MLVHIARLSCLSGAVAVAIVVVAGDLGRDWFGDGGGGNGGDGGQTEAAPPPPPGHLISGCMLSGRAAEP